MSAPEPTRGGALRAFPRPRPDRAAWQPKVYAYDDFRRYLKDFYAAAKANIYGFSYRSFSRQAGFTSPNFLKLVIDGARKLGPESVDRFAKALHLDGAQVRFFRVLVAFNQAATAEEKNAAYARMSATRGFRAARRVDGELFRYLSHWYYPAIREMVARADFREDPAWIAAQLVPPIDPAEADEAVALLLRLGLVERDDRGRPSRGEPSLTTGEEVTSLAVVNYHDQMLERAVAAVPDLPSDVRDISALTLCVRRCRVAELKRRLEEFRTQILGVYDHEDDPDIVYQLNIQLFPLTRPRRKAA